MAKFAIFHAGRNMALEQIDADYIQQDKQFVKFYKYENSSDGMPGSRQIAAVHLDKGQLVREIG